ncbi:MAG: CDGSH iron-sulfur domain-containing protein [Gemmatimonadaceae bacterium]
MPLVVKVRHNGPHSIGLATGDVEIVDGDGNPIEIPSGKPDITRYRCGASKHKPFRHSSHKTLCFDELAPPAVPLPPKPPTTG